MTDQRRAPLVPPEVDLRDFGFMPLHVGRLLSSSLWIKAKRDPRVGHAAMSLWCKAWHEVPAASLPDDDELLADFAGCTPDEWQRVRDKALAHFVRCSDGRLYHETIAAEALSAWEAKQARFARTAAATAARGTRRKAHDERDVQRGADVTFTKGQGQGQGQLIPPSPIGEGSATARKRAPPPPAFRGDADLEELNGRHVVLLDAAWELPTAWGLDAESLGWQRREVLREAERFRQYWTAGKGGGTRRGVKGWRQAWGNWLAKAERMQR